VAASRSPSAITKAEAVQIASELLASGHQSIDVGLAQINSRNFFLLGLGLEDAFRPCASIAAAARLLGLFSQYNRGSPELRDGYAPSVMTRIHALKVAAIGTPEPAAPAPPSSPPAAVYARPAHAGRELVYSR
jgi:type IV secretion system protein VirB1